MKNQIKSVLIIVLVIAAIKEVEATTPEGQALIMKHGILSSPGILINDEFFSMGGATEKQLREKFEALKQK